MRALTIIAILLFSAILSHAQGSAKIEITDSVFVEMYVKLSLAAERHLDQPEKLAPAQDSIFTEFKVVRQDFEKFREKLDSDVKKWENVWSKIVTRLEQVDKARGIEEKNDDTETLTAPVKTAKPEQK